MSADKVLDIIHQAIDELATAGKSVSKDPGTVLLGKDGALGSIDLVNLIVATEQRIEDQLDLQITIASEKAFAQKTSPFRTLGGLTEYVAGLVAEASGP